MRAELDNAQKVVDTALGPVEAGSLLPEESPNIRTTLEFGDVKFRWNQKVMGEKSR